MSKQRGKLKHIFIALLLILWVIIAFLGYFDPIKDLLESEQLTLAIGSKKLTLYALIKGAITIAALLWLTNLSTSAGTNYIKRLRNVKASNRALLIKGLQVGVYFLMALLGLDIMGIDLTSLTVFGGAVGIGVGFGLQKITSNFISGLILLFEKSVEEGDFIEFNDGLYAFVRQTNARYTLIETLDNKEIMVPNEDLITSRVVNWTYSDKAGRLSVDIGVCYDSDVEKVRELLLEAASEYEGCSKDHPVDCYLSNFGDSAIEFKVFFWVDDVSIGTYLPRSDVRRAIWKKLKDNKVEIPFPQREVRIKNIDQFKSGGKK